MTRPEGRLAAAPDADAGNIQRLAIGLSVDPPIEQALKVAAAQTVGCQTILDEVCTRARRIVVLCEHVHLRRRHRGKPGREGGGLPVARSTSDQQHRTQENEHG